MTFHVSMVIQKIPMCPNNIRHTLENATKYSLFKASLKFSWYNTFPEIQSLFSLILHLVWLETQMHKLTILKITFTQYFHHYSQILLDNFICSGKKYPFNWEICLSFRLEWYQARGFGLHIRRTLLQAVCTPVSVQIKRLATAAEI